jgi:hypothetical protein
MGESVLLVEQYLSEHWALGVSPAMKLMTVMLDVAYREGALELGGDQLPLFTMELLDWLLSSAVGKDWTFTPFERSRVTAIMLEAKTNNANRH